MDDNEYDTQSTKSKGGTKVGLLILYIISFIGFLILLGLIIWLFFSKPNIPQIITPALATLTTSTLDLASYVSHDVIVIGSVTSVSVTMSKTVTPFIFTLVNNTSTAVTITSDANMFQKVSPTGWAITPATSVTVAANGGQAFFWAYTAASKNYLFTNTFSNSNSQLQLVPNTSS